MKNMIRALVALASFALTSALFGATSVDISVSAGETVQIQLWGTNDGQVRLIDTATNQVVVDGSMLTSGGGYGNSYWGYGNSYVSGVTFTIGSLSYITGLPTGNYRLEVSTPLCTGWSMSSGNYYELHDWGTWDAMDYYVQVY